MPVPRCVEGLPHVDTEPRRCRGPMILHPRAPRMHPPSDYEESLWPVRLRPGEDLGCKGGCKVDAPLIKGWPSESLWLTIGSYMFKRPTGSRSPCFWTWGSASSTGFAQESLGTRQLLVVVDAPPSAWRNVTFL